VGRWYSDAFLRYIRKQVQDFTTGVSGKMIANPQFFTIPDQGPGEPFMEDPRTSRNILNFSARGLINGLSAASSRLRGASLSLFH